MRVLLTGATGNVGSHTLPELVRQGHTVRCLTRDTRAHRRWAAHRPPSVTVAWGDLRDPAAVARAVDDVEVVVHLAAVIPPGSDERPAEAQQSNVDGTRHLIQAAVAAADRPRLLFTSTLDVHGYTVDRPPPRRVSDPLVATDGYSAQKIECERLIRESGLEWCVFRLADVPVLGLRRPHPIMYEIGLDNRIEALHADDAGLAIANALSTPAVWGRVLFIGGGPTCQLTYREYLTRLLGAMGLAMLPEAAFREAPYVTDWLDTEEGQRLLGYQRHSFADIAAAIAGTLGWRRRFVPLAAPVARRAMLRLSPYWRGPRP